MYTDSQRGTHTNWRFAQIEASAAPTLTDLGEHFPVVSTTNVLTLAFLTAPYSSEISNRMVDEVSGTVVEVNPALEERPDWVHREPCGAGWIARVRLADFAADQALLLQGAAAHEAMAEHARAHAAVLSPSATGRPEGSP